MMDFSAGPRKKPCAMCGKDLEFKDEKSECERFTMHKSCFKCAICDVQLQQGSCSRDDGLHNVTFMKNYRKGAPVWFCRDHMMVGTGQKYEMLKKKHGVK